jgi:plasmid stabilization system protein ParE
MLKLRINPLVVNDLKGIHDYIAEDNREYAAKTINGIYEKFENIQMFPGIGADLSRRASSPYRKSLCIFPVYFSDSTGQKASP